MGRVTPSAPIRRSRFKMGIGRLLGIMLLVPALFQANSVLAFHPDADDGSYSIPIAWQDCSLAGGHERDLGERRVESTFVGRHGGDWRVMSWNPWTHTASDLISSGVRLADLAGSAAGVERMARRFVDANTDLLGTDSDRLELVGLPHALGKWTAQFQQTHDGLPVHGAGLRVTISDEGWLMLLGSDCFAEISLNSRPSLDAEAAKAIAVADLPPSRSMGDTAPELIVLPVPRSDFRTDFRLVWRFRLRTVDPVGDWVNHVDAHSGEIIWRYNDTRFAYGGDAQIDAQIWSACDPVTQTPLAYATIEVAGLGSTISDGDGLWNIEGDGGGRLATVSLDGPYTTVINNTGQDALFTGTVYPGSPTTIDFTMGQLGERNAFQALGATRDFLLSIDPDLAYANHHMTVLVNAGVPCQAWWNRGEITMGMSGYDCNSMAEIQQVVIHEFGHGLNHALLRAQQGWEGLDEGNPDILACFVSRMHELGVGVPENDCVTVHRDALNSLRYPEDVIGQESHYAGMVASGFHWDSMVLLQAALGDDAGWRKAVELWHFGRKLQRPLDLQSQVLATFIADDDDGDLSNGTPHFAQLYQAALNHGLEIFAPILNPNLVVLFTPVADEALSSAATVEFDWSDVDSAIFYELMIDTDENFGSPVIVDYATVSELSTFSFDQSGTHYWRVRAFVGTGFGDWSETRPFDFSYHFAATQQAPGDGDNGVLAYTDIIAGFNENVDQSTVDTTSFSVVGSVSGQAAGSFLFWGGKGVKFMPDVDFEFGETVTVTLSTDIVSLDTGLPLPQAQVWSFQIEGSGAKAAEQGAVMVDNYPNPFNPNTTIRFNLDESGPVSLKLYDARGRLVRTLVDEQRAAGAQQAIWNGKDDRGHQLASGTYFYRLGTTAGTVTKKMILIK